MQLNYFFDLQTPINLSLFSINLFYWDNFRQGLAHAALDEDELLTLERDANRLERDLTLAGE